MGITVHWTLLVVDNPASPHIYYMDSVNYPLKSILAEDYTGIAMNEEIHVDTEFHRSQGECL